MDLLLPASAQEIADVIGREKTLYLIGQLTPCGHRSWRVVLYVPKGLPVGHWLVQVLGWRAASALSREFGGEILQPSNCLFVHRAYRDRAICRMAKQGVPTRQIAEAIDVTSRTVRCVLARAGMPRRCGAHQAPATAAGE